MSSEYWTTVRRAWLWVQACLMMALLACGSEPSSAPETFGTTTSQTQDTAPAVKADDPASLFAQGLSLYTEGQAVEGVGSEFLRFVAVGYMKLSDGRHVPEMVMLAVGPPMKTRPSRLHSHNHGPKPISLCAAFLRPDNVSERAARDAAIKALQKGEVPAGNPAWEWASNHHLGRQHCRPVHGPKSGEGVHWSIRRNGKTLIFRSDDWMGADYNGKLVLQLPLASALGK